MRRRTLILGLALIERSSSHRAILLNSFRVDVLPYNT